MNLQGVKIVVPPDRFSEVLEKLKTTGRKPLEYFDPVGIFLATRCSGGLPRSVEGFLFICVRMNTEQAVTQSPAMEHANETQCTNVTFQLAEVAVVAGLVVNRSWPLRQSCYQGKINVKMRAIWEKSAQTVSEFQTASLR